MYASTNKIYIGLRSGDIIYFDPVSQNLAPKHIFSNEVTSLRVVKNHPISSSLDGSIFYKRKIKISSSGISDVCYVNEDTFICSCDDNSIAMCVDDVIKTFSGHKAKIESLTYQTVGTSSSSDGILGLLLDIKIPKQTHQLMKDFGCSKHIQIPSDKVLGYGLNSIKVHDLSYDTTYLNFPDSTRTLDYKNNVIANGIGTDVFFRDIRTSENFSIDVGAPVSNVSFSSNGCMILVQTPEYHVSWI